MDSNRVLAAGLILELCRRVTANPAPTWPISILEAEADLYPYFLRHLLGVCDALDAAGVSTDDAARCFRSPSRIVEFSYFLFGARQSGLALPERRRLAEHLAAALASARPADPLCRRGGNQLLPQHEIAELVDAQATVHGSEQRTASAHLRAALFALAEIVHVGIPQYGREVHGPYPIDADQFMLVRDYFDLRMPDVWPATAEFPFDEIRIAETYHGSGILVAFDISNHVTTALPPRDLLAGQMIRVRRAAETTSIRDIDTGELQDATIAAHARLLADTRDYRPDDWFRQHHRTRYRYLKPHVERVGGLWQPPPEAYLSARSTAPPGGAAACVGEMSSEQLYCRLCADLGLSLGGIDDER